MTYKTLVFQEEPEKKMGCISFMFLTKIWHGVFITLISNIQPCLDSTTFSFIVSLHSFSLFVFVIRVLGSLILHKKMVLFQVNRSLQIENALKLRAKSPTETR